MNYFSRECVAINFLSARCVLDCIERAVIRLSIYRVFKTADNKRIDQ